MSAGDKCGRRGEIRFSSSVAIIVVALVLVGCGKTVHSYRYPDPGGGVDLVIEPEGGRPIAPGRKNEVSLLGAAPPEAPDAISSPPGEKLRIGSFVGLWAPASIYWVDATTVNVCPLAKDPKAKTAVNILVTERTRQVYRITTDCTKARRALRIAPGS